MDPRVSNPTRGGNNVTPNPDELELKKSFVVRKINSGKGRRKAGGVRREGKK